MMDFKITEEAGTITGTLAGRLDTLASVQLAKDIQPLMDKADETIVLDCDKLDYICSSGLRAFLSLKKASQAKGGKVIVKNINDEIRKVFVMTGFYNLFDIE
jgi:anti-sigma B factor antagonist